jgi:hypothetical protein
VSAAALPGQPDFDLSDGRNFLVAPTPWQRHGPAFEILLQFWLSGPGGWPEPVYRSTSDQNGRSLGLSAEDTSGRTLEGDISNRTVTPL